MLVRVIVDEGPKWDLPWRSSLSVGCFVRGGKNGMGCYVRGDKNSIGCYVWGDKNSMGCFVRGGKFLWDVLSGVSKNGMGCFVPGCFVRLPQNLYNKTEQNRNGKIICGVLMIRIRTQDHKTVFMRNSAERWILTAHKTKKPTNKEVYLSCK